MKRVLTPIPNDPVGTRERVIDAYLALAYEGRVDGITLHQIAKRARVAYGTVRYHFNEQDKPIADAAIEHIVGHGQRFVAAYLQAETPRSRKLAVEVWVEANFEWASRYPMSMSFMAFYFYRCSALSRYREMNAVFLGTAAQRVQDLLYVDVGKGRLAPVVDMEDLVVSLHALIIGSVLRAISNPKLASMKAASLQCEAATRALLIGHAGADVKKPSRSTKSPARA